MALCEKYNVALIEDAAESLGTYYRGKHTGTFGKFGVFSFNGNKIITTLGGGMLVSDDEEKIAKTRFWATQSRDNARHYQLNYIEQWGSGIHRIKSSCKDRGLKEPEILEKGTLWM